MHAQEVKPMATFQTVALLMPLFAILVLSHLTPGKVG